MMHLYATIKIVFTNNLMLSEIVYVTKLSEKN